MSGERDHEIYKRRLSRNLLVGGLLGALVVLVFAVTIVKLRENATNPMAELFDAQLRYRDERPLSEREAPPAPAVRVEDAAADDRPTGGEE